MSHKSKLAYIAVLSLIALAAASLVDIATPRAAFAAYTPECPNEKCNGTSGCTFNTGTTCQPIAGGCMTTFCIPGGGS